MNLALNKVLKKKIKLFEDVFVETQYLKKHSSIIINFDSKKSLTSKDVGRLYQLIHRYKPKLKKIFNADFMEIYGHF